MNYWLRQLCVAALIFIAVFSVHVLPAGDSIALWRWAIAAFFICAASAVVTGSRSRPTSFKPDPVPQFPPEEFVTIPGFGPLRLAWFVSLSFGEEPQTLVLQYTEPEPFPIISGHFSSKSLLSATLNYAEDVDLEVIIEAVEERLAQI
ncbi:MAG: hypothetical protein AAGH89_08825 [Verrucomicrobiota bacterium]